MSKKQRLLIVSDFFYPHWTGIAKSVFSLAQMLAKDMDIKVLALQHIRNFKSIEYIKGITIHRAPTVIPISRTYLSIKYIPLYIKLLIDCDTVLINTPSTYILPVSIIAFIMKKHFIMFHQGDLILPHGVLNTIIQWIFDLSTHIAAMIAYKVSTYTKDYAAQSRILKFQLHKFTPLLMPIITTTPDLKPLSIPKHKILIGFAGRFVEEKGFDILFNAIPQILQYIPTAHFIYAGETHMRYEHFFEKHILQYKKIKNHITLMGLLNDKQLAQFYRSLQLFVAPSRSDCFNLTQAESMIYGTPVVVSNIPGLRETVIKTGYGLLCKPQDPDDLAKQIITAVMRNNQLRKHHDKVLTFFDTAHMIRQWRLFLSHHP